MADKIKHIQVNGVTYDIGSDDGGGMAGVVVKTFTTTYSGFSSSGFGDFSLSVENAGYTPTAILAVRLYNSREDMRPIIAYNSYFDGSTAYIQMQNIGNAEVSPYNFAVEVVVLYADTTESAIKTFTVSNLNINSSGYGSCSLSVESTGYTPVAVADLRMYNSREDYRPIVAYDAYFDGNTAYLQIYAVRDADTASILTYSSEIVVLYTAS